MGSSESPLPSPVSRPVARDLLSVLVTRLVHLSQRVAAAATSSTFPGDHYSSLCSHPVLHLLPAVIKTVFLPQCPHRPWPDRQWGLCIFDDVIEHCSPSSFKYAEYFLRPMLQYVCDSSPEVRQAAAYGLGVMAQYGGESYRPFCTGTIERQTD